ncbi:MULTISPECIES: sialidase family protein [unclassified Duganella]|uniref:sialidase family protein n=1 Tax=unclassified Duganella TaxID=2636909 RepID=UPI0006F4FDEA|nr:MULTISPECIES: sialidase family protein [unclassified Duganella]KQV61494.1 dockerin [Duganella sp. Root336D2]KRB92414.1 dockerin [Duganella sp. Root198D2]
MKKQTLALACLVAGLAAGCGGESSPATQSPSFAATVTTSSAAGTATGSRWMNVKFGGSGYVPGLVFHPTSPNVLYARTDMGGSYRWEAATSTWIPITDGFGIREEFFNGAESIALDASDDKRVYLVTGLYDWAGSNGRLYISSDRGDNWTHVDLPFRVGSNDPGRAIGERLMVDPNQSSVLFYGSRTAGLWKSSDHGQNWAQVTSLSSFQYPADQIPSLPGRTSGGIEGVLFDTSSTGAGAATQGIYATVAPDYANAAGLSFSLYKSTDGGASWTGIATPVSGYHIPHMVRARDGMIYMVFTRDIGPGAGGPARLYKFDGSNWTLLKGYDTEQWVNFGLGGLSVHGSGPTTRIALGVTNSWGNWQGQPIVQLSDDAGQSWREIASMTPHTPSGPDFAGWIDDVEIDPNNPDRILHVFGGGVWGTSNASAAAPAWNLDVNGLEETATLGLATPPKGASYTLLRSSGDIGMHVQTELLKTPTRGPRGWFGNGNSADMAWSTPSYIAAIGTPVWNTPNVAGAYSSDSGLSWTAFAANHPDGVANTGGESNIAVTKPGHIVWAPSNSRPAYTTDNGASWSYTNLPALGAVGINRGYRVVADRKNPNKVYAYNSGGAWWNQWSDSAHFWTSTDGGHTFTESTTLTAAGALVADFGHTSLAVNPNAEGDIWLADGFSIFHSTDSGANWTRLAATAPIWGRQPSWMYPEVYGATSIALGRAPAGAAYSSSIYIVGTINGVWGVHRSDDGGVNWRRINDDKHQYAGLGNLAADQSVPGRVFASAAGRGVVFSY